MNMNQDAYNRLVSCGVRPSMQRLAIMDYLLTHHTHPTVEEVYQGICKDIRTLSRTTVYNTLRLLSEHNAARMITIDEHRVCYDGDVTPHVHFYCRNCGHVYDLFDEEAPYLAKSKQIEGHVIDEMQLYYKGVCKDCKSYLS